MSIKRNNFRSSGLGVEGGEDADDKMVVFVEKKTTSFELGEERLDGASHCLQLLERDALLDVRYPPKTSGLDAVV